MTILIVGGNNGDRNTLPPVDLDAELAEYIKDSERHPVTNRPPPTVLLVDDDHAIIEALTELIRSERDYGVETARDGLEALNKLFDGPRPSLIVLDVWMPRLTGIGFLRAFEMTSFANIPVLLISAGTRPDTMSKGDDRYLFLSKPLQDIDSILALIDKKIAEGKIRNG